MQATKFDIEPFIIKSEAARMEFLPRHVKGGGYIAFETAVYDFAQKSTADYKGGFWQFVELPYVVQGTKLFFMFPCSSNPQKVFHCTNPDNYYDGEMSDLAFGAACTLAVLNALAWAWNGKNREYSLFYSEHFHALKNWVLDNIPDGIEVHKILD